MERNVSSRETSAGKPTADEHRSWRVSLAAWWKRLVADQALEKAHSIIRLRQDELSSLIDDARVSQGSESLPELAYRLERARQLVDEKPEPNDRASAEELLARLDGIVPLIANDQRLFLMIESELGARDGAFSEVEHRLAGRLLREHRDSGLKPAPRRQLEVLVTAALRERSNRLREERITGELQKNYLTWLGLVLILVLPGAAGLAVVADRYGLWADVLLAIFAGALGGTVSGVIRLRTPETHLGALKNLGLVLFVQPLLGAVGGIVLFAIWRSGLLTVKGLEDHNWSSTAVVAFAGGFSERLFLKSLERITGSRDQEQAGEARQSTGA